MRDARSSKILKRAGFRWDRALPSVGLRWRLSILVLLVILPAAVLFIVHSAHDRERLVAAAEARALRVARAWAENHDAILAAGRFLLEAAASDQAVEQGDPAACA